MFLTITLADIANSTIFSDRIPESAGLLLFAGVLFGSAVIIRKIIGRRENEGKVTTSKN
jgi:hypothetical protein